LTDQHRQFFSDPAVLTRYLKSRDWNLSLAYELLLKSLRWRDEFGAWDLSEKYEKELHKEGATGKTYVHGEDKLGRPAIYMRDRYQNTTDYENQVRFTVHNFENASKMMDKSKGVQQWVLIIDFNGHSLKNAPPMKVTKEILNIMMDQYPERLGVAFMIDAPFLFQMTWKVVSMWLTESTKAKVNFVSGDVNQKREIFSKYFDLDVLESDFGGNNHFEYDHEHYRKIEAQNREQLKKFLEESAKKKTPKSTPKDTPNGTPKKNKKKIKEEETTRTGRCSRRGRTKWRRIIKRKRKRERKRR